MNLESVDDLANFFDEDEHAVSVTWTPAGKAAVTITAIFEAPYYTDDLAAEIAGIESSQPVIRCVSTDVADARHRDVIEFGAADRARLDLAASYIIVNVRPDGTGVTDLALREAP